MIYLTKENNHLKYTYYHEGISMEKVDVLVIGAGLLGCFTARNLARYEMDILVLEKESDVARGISKANTGIIYAGYDNKPGTLKSRLCVHANESFGGLTRQLDVHFKRTGSLMISYGPRADRVIRRKYENGMKSGVQGLRLLTGSEALELEPGLSAGITSALYSENTGTVNPWELCIAAYENARDNGVEFRMGTEVLSVREENNRLLVETGNALYSAGAVVNVAGLSSDKVRELIKAPRYRLYPTAADYIVLDTSEGGKLKHIIFHEGESGKGLTLVPTVDGNILVGPTNRDPEDDHPQVTGYAAHSGGLAELKSLCGEIAPSLDMEKQIRAFGSLRPNMFKVREETGIIVRDDTRIHDFSILEENGFFSLIGIKTPGLTISNELGRLAADKAAAHTGRTTIRKNFDPHRRAIIRARDLDTEDLAELIQKDPDYGEILCGCMEVSRAEILEAIRRGAHDFEGIKHRTHVGMGRCQGSRCAKRILDILSESNRA